MSSSPRPVVLFLLVVLFNFFTFSAIFHAISVSGQQIRREEFGHEGDQKQKPRGIQHRHRWRRAPAVWGEPAPDYSMASLDHSTHLYLYALLFVDLKTSDHYRREHGLVKREVMRLAREANNYFYQINLHLIVVDVLETFRDDLSLYSFEQYRNQRAAQLPFHNFAVLITYRYAGGLAFVGGMCSPKSVMLAGFYPHNPEAMGSIFFHEVAHLIGVPHRPANESLDVPNCPCPRGGHQSESSASSLPLTPSFNQTGEPISKTSLILDAPGAHQFRGCLKIPGFDQDCSLQLMVNLAQRTRCLAREPREDLPYSLPLCGNGIREGNEQCDCGLASKCGEWNCEPYSCSRKWQPRTIWLLTICLCLAIACPPLLCLWLHQTGRCCFPSSFSAFFLFSPTKRCGHRRRLPLFSFMPLPLGPTASSAKNSKPNIGNHQKQNRQFRRLNNAKTTGNWNGKQQQKSSTMFGERILAHLASMLRTIWEWLKRRKENVWWRRRTAGGLKDFPSIEICENNNNSHGKMIQRPTRAPPPPPPPIKTLLDCQSSSSSTLTRPKRPPPPLPSPPSIRPIRRPTVMPPAPPPLQKWKRELEDWRRKEEEEGEEEKVEDEDEEDEWDDYCE